MVFLTLIIDVDVDRLLVWEQSEEETECNGSNGIEAGFSARSSRLASSVMGG